MFDTDGLYNPNAIFDEAGPIDPWFMAEAIQALMRAMPLDTPEPEAAQRRHLQSALTALAATNPRDPIEVMLGVQAISAYQAACACWRTGMNSQGARSDGLRHVAAAGAAARTFDQMLRAMERRQAKPLAAPIGRPASAVWSENNAGAVLDAFAERIRRMDQGVPVAEKPAQAEAQVRWSAEDMAFTERLREQRRIEQENKGLDITNTEVSCRAAG